MSKNWFVWTTFFCHLRHRCSFNSLYYPASIPALIREAGFKDNQEV